MKPIKKFILPFILALGMAVARPLSPQEQISIHDTLIQVENQTWSFWYYSASNPNEVSFYLGKATGLGEAALTAYQFDTTESLLTQLNWTAYMLSQLALYETDPLERAYLNGMANGYYHAYSIVSTY